MSDSIETRDKTQDNWEAIHDFMPPNPARLRVKGCLQLPTPGHTLSLKRAVPQGFNPQILLLELKNEAPTGVVPQVITATEVTYEQQTDFKYTHITIVPDGPTIEVQQVH